jgi:phosphatidylglycerophosphate synthase
MRQHYPDYMGVLFSRLSIRLSYLFSFTSITPNELTTLSLVAALAGAVLIQDSNYWNRLSGIVLWFVAYVLDFCDGDIARYRNMKSEFGDWFDAVTDRVKDTGLFAAVTMLVARGSLSTLVVVIGMVALGGTLVHSYAATYGFKAMGASKSPADKFGNIGYPLVTFFLIIDSPFIFLLIMAILTLTAIMLSIHTTLTHESNAQVEDKGHQIPGLGFMGGTYPKPAT